MTRTQSSLQTQRVRLAIMRLIGVMALVACMAALLWWQANSAQATFAGQNGEITFEGRGSQGTGIFSVGPDGSGLSQLTEETGYNPSYSADGSMVVFDTERDGNQEIYTMNADGGN